MIVLPYFFDSNFSNSKTSFPVFVSKLPVGSSASMIVGLFIRDLAMATLCCCPPLRLTGFCFALSPIPKMFKSFKERADLSLAPIPLLYWEFPHFSEL